MAEQTQIEQNIHTNRNDLNQADEKELKELKNPMMSYIVVIIAVFLVLALAVFFVMKPKKEDVKEETKVTTEYNAQSKDFVASLLANKEEKKEQEIQEIQNKKSRDTEPASASAPVSSVIEEKIIKKPKIYKTAIIAGSAANVATSQNSSNLKFKEKPKTVLDFGQGDSDGYAMGVNPLSNDNGDIYQPTAAHFSKMNPTLLLSKGSYIGCSLKTKLVSDIKGGIACVISNDVYSSNGQTLLIEKGSLVTGTYASGAVKEGQERLYVIWQEIRTPNNIIIPVFSGASDELGGAGIPGWVDNHYFKRFGAAILVSVIDDAFAALGTHLSKDKDNSYDRSANTRETTNELATKVLDKMINIQPTLYKNQGELVGIYVNKDIDFSNVYELKRIEAK